MLSKSFWPASPPRKSRETFSRSRTSLPSRAVAILLRAVESRGSGTSAIRALAASMRNLGLAVRAGAPRRSQASSFFTSCWRLLSTTDRGAVALGAGQHVGGVAAVERVHDAVVDFPGLGADFVEEPAVVGDHEEGALVGPPAGLQVPGQPGDAFDVEVVGGLVEHDDVVVLDQELGQGHAPLLPAGERVDVGVPVDVGHQAAHDLADLRVAGPFVVGLVADDRGTDGEVAVEHVALVQVADVDARCAWSPGRSPGWSAWPAGASAWTCRRRSGPPCRSGRPPRGRG